MRVVLVEPQLNMEIPINLEVSMNRGYHMAARSYEISLRVLKCFFQHEKRNFVSASGHVLFYLLYKHQ